MKKRIAIPLVCLCVALLLAGGLALLIHSGLSIADALGMLLEKPFGETVDFPKETHHTGDTAEPVPHEHNINEAGPCYCGNAYITHLKNGGWEITEYDPDRRWLPILETEYDAEGNVVKVTRYEREYEKPDDPEPKHTFVYENDVLVYEEEREYDPHRRVTRAREIEYDAEGNPVRVTRHEHEYENPGDREPKHTLTYENDVLIREEICDVYPEADPDNAYLEIINYQEDGSRIVNLYRHEYRDFALYYDAEGGLTKTEKFEYTCDTMGRILGEVQYVNDVRTYEYLRFRSPIGAWYWDYEIYYDENGDPERHYTWEYTYDEWREPNHQVKKLNGAVIEETFFVEEYGYGQYVCRVITYGEDGQVLTDTYYDREGNEITP